LLSNVELNLESVSTYKMSRAMIAAKEYLSAIPLLKELLETPRGQIATVDLRHDLLRKEGNGLKKKRFAISIGVLCIFLVGSLYVGNEKDSAQATNVAEIVEAGKTYHDKAKLKDVMGITLETPKEKAKIDTNKVLEAAQQGFSGLVNTPSDIRIEYHLMTNPSMRSFSPTAMEKNPKLKSKGFMEQLPVYIVTFRGVDYQRHAPIGQSAKTEKREINVVVDAETGEVLQAFSYR
jgi:hypothetical protein